MQNIKVPQLAWYNPCNYDLPMPDNWNIEVCYMKGYDRPEIDAKSILYSLQNPIGTAPLRQLASGKKEVAIVFDDLTRATRTSKIVPHVLSELSAAGIPDNKIRFICGLGMHGVMNRTDFIKKLGEDVVSRYKVFNHNPFGNCIYVGTTNTFKTKVYINEEYMRCDLKIVIGSCVPHGVAGFGGGSKLIMPGIASFDTVNHHHGTAGAAMAPVDTVSKPVKGMGIIDNNPFKKDIDEAAELAGIDFLINTTLNLWGESTAIYAGNWKMAFNAALLDAKTHYRTPKIQNQNIVIANSYTKVNESNISLAAALPMVSREGGDIVIITNAPEGQVIHYLVGIFGNNSFAPQYSLCNIPPYVHNVIVLNEYPFPGSSWFENHDKIIYKNSWQEVLELLRKTHGPDSRVAVIPDSTNQYFAWYD